MNSNLEIAEKNAADDDFSPGSQLTKFHGLVEQLQNEDPGPMLMTYRACTSDPCTRPLEGVMDLVKEKGTFLDWLDDRSQLRTKLGKGPAVTVFHPNGCDVFVLYTAADSTTKCGDIPIITVTSDKPSPMEKGVLFLQMMDLLVEKAEGRTKIEVWSSCDDEPNCRDVKWDCVTAESDSKLAVTMNRENTAPDSGSGPAVILTLPKCCTYIIFVEDP